MLVLDDGIMAIRSGFTGDTYNTAILLASYALATRTSNVSKQLKQYLGDVKALEANM